MTISISDIPAPVADVKVEEVEGELLLYHPAQTTAVYLNPSAAVIWTLCNGQRPVSEIIGLIEESYPEAKPGLTEDVFATLAQLQDSHVIAIR